MHYNDIFKIYKTIYNKINGLDYPKIIYPLKNKYRISQFKKLEDIDLDYEKYFYANLTLRNDFWISNILDNKSIELYHHFDTFINENTKPFFIDILTNLKNFDKLDLEDRDAFILIFKKYSLKMWAAFYPEIKELLESMDGDDNKKTIKTITRYNMLLQKMPNYWKIKEKINCKLL